MVSKKKASLETSESCELSEGQSSLSHIPKVDHGESLTPHQNLPITE